MRSRALTSFLPFALLLSRESITMGVASIPLRTQTKDALRSVIPLRVRKRLAIWIGRQPWIPDRTWWSMELVRDLARTDPNSFHHFLWLNHLAYADTYEVPLRYGEDHLHPSRVVFFDELTTAFDRSGMSRSDIGSVYEVGCSMGYLLHHIENTVCPGATVVEGMDIDRYAIEEGRRKLRELDSRAVLSHGDMRDLRRLLEGRSFDLVLCAGVLMYLDEVSARETVAEMLRHCDRIVAIAGLAHPSLDNAGLARSEIRQRDGAFIHNVDRMVERAGGRVVHRRWDGPRSVGGNTIYFVFAEPASAAVPAWVEG